MLVLRDAQLVAYDCNPLALAGTAMPLGHLRFRAVDAQRLPPVDLPDQPLAAAPPHEAPAPPDHPLIESAVRLIQSQQRVALVGMRQPLSALADLLDRLTRKERSQMSFATGLQPSQHRPFRIHFLPSVDARAYNRLSAQHIRCIASKI
jgi:hypothetical protein